MSGKLSAGGKLVIASHNPGKLKEIGSLLAPYNVAAMSAADFGLPEPEETGTTFRQNAEIKARAAVAGTGLPALADDSGIEVEGLGGAPGVYSADWGGPDKDFAGAMQRVHYELSALGLWSDNQSEAPRANFNATLALAWPSGDIQFFEGRVFGHLVWPPRGKSGFGYDPMFVADGETKTFGEMTREEKSGWTGGRDVGLSHRARALAQFISTCIDAGE